ncbi:MAG: hypothetical protein ACKOWL_04995 [Sphingobacteriaceae bacterium]
MKKTLLFLLLLACITCCRKEKKIPINIDCAAFTTALKTDDFAAIEKQVNAFFDSRKPAPPIDTDMEGYRAHFEELAKQIDGCDELTVTFFCYYCLQTAPPTGWYKISLFVNGQEVNRTIYTIYDKITHQYRLKNYF